MSYYEPHSGPPRPTRSSAGHLVQVATRDAMALAQAVRCLSPRCPGVRTRPPSRASMSFLISRAPPCARIAGERTLRMMSGMSARRRHQRARHGRLDGDGARRQDAEFAVPLGERARLRPRATAALRAQSVARSLTLRVHAAGLTAAQQRAARGSTARGSTARGSKARGSKVHGSMARGSTARDSTARGSTARGYPRALPHPADSSLYSDSSLIAP